MYALFETGGGSPILPQNRSSSACPIDVDANTDLTFSSDAPPPLPLSLSLTIIGDLVEQFSHSIARFSTSPSLFRSFHLILMRVFSF